MSRGSTLRRMVQNARGTFRPNKKKGRRRGLHVDPVSPKQLGILKRVTEAVKGLGKRRHAS